MNKIVKVEGKNKDGIVITKEIPKDMLSMYLATGWSKYEEKKIYKPSQPKVDNNE